MSVSVNVTCIYKNDINFETLGHIYYCTARYKLNIFSSESAVITGATGIHKGNKTDDNVLGFAAKEAKIEFFPRGLQKHFKNLKLI